jgi:hypothetical protein
MLGDRSTADSENQGSSRERGNIKQRNRETEKQRTERKETESGRKQIQHTSRENIRIEQAEARQKGKQRRRNPKRTQP